MTAGWAALNTLRETLAIAWPEGDWIEPNVFTESLAGQDKPRELAEPALPPSPDKGRDAAVAGAVSLPAVLLAKVEALRDRERV